MISAAILVASLSSQPVLPPLSDLEIRLYRAGVREEARADLAELRAETLTRELANCEAGLEEAGRYFEATDSSGSAPWWITWAALGVGLVSGVAISVAVR